MFLPHELTSNLSSFSFTRKRITQARAWRFTNVREAASPSIRCRKNFEYHPFARISSYINDICGAKMSVKSRPSVREVNKSARISRASKFGGATECSKKEIAGKPCVRILDTARTSSGRELQGLIMKLKIPDWMPRGVWYATEMAKMLFKQLSTV